MKIYISEEGKVPVSAGNIGLFFEDINYGLDGGLYAELLENRNFEAKDVHGERDNYIVDEDGAYGWTPTAESVTTKIKTDRPLFPENPHYMRLVTAEPNTGVKNKAYDGIYLTKGMGYKVSFWARSYSYKGKATLGVYDGADMVMGKKVSLKADGKWRRYAFRLKCKLDAERAEFRFTLQKAGMVHVDCFSMIPENAVLGIFRRDLAELMKEMKPGFLRFPGGCVIEGNSLENRYNWKNSVGPTERRKHNWNRWAVHCAGPENNFRAAYSHYGQTLGVGYFEYFRLCEYIGAKPLPVVNMGMACQFMSTEFVPVESHELETYIQDALDVIEFANGGPDTVWGRVRAEMGHPEPFGLEYLGLGNEQWEASVKQKDGVERSNEFYKRFELFEQRIHAQYPEIKLIGTVGPGVGNETHASAWKWTRENLAKNPNFVYASDEHFYVSPEWLYANVNVYDEYPRDGKVFAGEYAAHIPGLGCGMFNAPQTNCWEGALAEAAFMTGLERNSDVVVMASYAPLFARLGYTQWSPDLIWFDGKAAYPTPSYYVQKLFSLYTGDYSLKVTLDAEQMYASATERDGFTYLKVVNAGETAQELEVEGEHDFGQLTRIVRLEGALSDYNTPVAPDTVAPKEIAPTAPRSAQLPPRSLSVLVFRK